MPRKRSILPACVPASIFNFTFPSTVGTSTCVPKATSAKLMYKSKTILLPSRFKIKSSASSINIIKSPAGPPIGPAFPFPLMLSCMPLATPAGIFTETTSSLFTNPSALEPAGRLPIIRPVPWQV